MQDRLSKYLHRGIGAVAGLAILAVIFEVILRGFSVPTYIFPTPTAVGVELINNLRLFLGHLSVTVYEALAGFLIGNISGIIVGAIFSQFTVVRRLFYPIVFALQSVPIVAIAPFIVVWFGPGPLGKALLAALVCYFPTTVVSTFAFQAVTKDAKEHLLSMGASKLDQFRLLSAPSAIPNIASVLEISTALAFIGAVVAEMSGADRGIGYLVVRASYSFNTPRLFAALSITAAATVTLFLTVRLSGKYLGRRYSFAHASN